MKVLDEKGKLFGKINLIDLIVIVVLVLILVAVGWKLAGSRIADAIESNAPVMEYEVLCTEIDPDTCDYAVAHIGDQLMSNGEMVNGTITNCVIEPHMLTVLNSEGVPVQVEDPDFHNLRFTIQSSVTETSNAYAVGSQELRVGKSHIVKTIMLEVTGFITSMEEVEVNE